MTRQLDPLDPYYTWPARGVPPHVFPVAPVGQEPDEWRRTSPPRTGSLDVRDIAGTSPQRCTRTRRDVYSAFDYSDLPRSSPEKCSPIRARLRDGREPLDNTRMGFWTKSGDTGKFMKASREPTNPTNPSYVFGNRVIADDANVGRSRQLHPQVVDPLRRSRVQESAPGELLSRTELLGGNQNQNQRSPQRRYQRGLLMYKDQLRRSEVAPVVCAKTR